jgi:hypothetical protein
MKAVFRQQIVQIIAGHPPRNFRVAPPGLVGIAPREFFEPLRPAATAAADQLQHLVAGGADLEPQPVVGQDVEFSTLSTVFPPITVWAPQELLPILPPSAQ